MTSNASETKKQSYRLVDNPAITKMDEPFVNYKSTGHTDSYGRKFKACSPSAAPVGLAQLSESEPDSFRLPVL